MFILKLLPTTLPETNIAPANGWLEDEYPVGKPYCQVLSFREGGSTSLPTKCRFFRDLPLVESEGFRI